LSTMCSGSVGHLLLLVRVGFGGSAAHLVGVLLLGLELMGVSVLVVRIQVWNVFLMG